MRHHSHQPERDTFRFLAVEGELLSDYFQAGIEDRRSETSVGWVYEHQQSRVCGNLQDSPQFGNERRLAAEGIQSICVLPMALQGKCIGTLSFVSRERDRYSKQDALFLQEVANQVVLAIQNMQSYQEIASLKARLKKRTSISARSCEQSITEEIVGNSPALLKVLRDVEQAFPPIRRYSFMGKRGRGRNWWRATHSRSTRWSRAGECELQRDFGRPRRE